MKRSQSSGEHRSPLESTLKLHGIEWAYFTHHGHLALGYQKFAICYEPSLKQYVIKESGEIIFSDIKMSRCLDMAPEIIFDYFSSQYGTISEIHSERQNQASSAA